MPPVPPPSPPPPPRRRKPRQILPGAGGGSRPCVNATLREALEAESWTEPNRASRQDLAEALVEVSPTSCVFVAQARGALVGAIFTQIIGAVDAVDQVGRVEASKLIQDPMGRVLQLIRVNTLARSGGENMRVGVGAALRDFALEWAEELGLTAVCAVTRCTDFTGRGQGLGFEEYALTRSVRGEASDPGLSFHLKKGARVVKCIPGWRPGDIANQGYGVLVYYNLAATEPKVKYTITIFLFICTGCHNVTIF